MPPLSRNELKEIIIAILVPFGVERIALFGSYARKENIAGSDVDILVRLRKPGKRKPIGLRWFTLDEEISKKIGMPVDLVSEDSVPLSLRSIIEKDLEVIYEEAG